MKRKKRTARVERPSTPIEDVQSRLDQDLLNSAYRAYGRAMNSAQVLENNILMLLVALEREASGIDTLDESERLYGIFSKRTLGQLMHLLRQSIPIPAKFEELLSEAINIRNLLAHRYFTDRLPSWLYAPGLKKIVSELKEARDKLDAMSEVVSTIYHMLFIGTEEERREVLDYLTQESLPLDGTVIE